jgi:RecA-family ATPase
MNAPVPPLQFNAGKRYASKLEAALDMARRGFRVFPILPDSKKPAIQEWQFAATRDEAKIREWFEGGDYNYGMVLDGIAVVDIDPRNGGNDTFPALQKEHGLNAELNPTLVSKTHSGGFHMVYKLREGVKLKSRAHAFGPGIDLKTGAGAYIVGPGSSINGNKYEILRDRPVGEMPASLVELAGAAGKPSEKSASAGKRLVEEDDEAVERARQWFEREALPLGISKGERDNSCFSIAAKLYDFGVSKETCRDFMLELNEQCVSPPLELDEIERIVDSASRNRQRAIGVNHPDNASGFEAVEIAEPEKRKKAESDPFEEPEQDKFPLVRADEMSRRAMEAPRAWLVENMMYAGDEAMLIGKPGEGKTFFALDYSYHVVKGKPFAGNKVTQGAVVYIAAEAQEGIKTRIRALEEHYGPLGDAPLYVIPAAPDLLHNLKDADALAKKIKSVGAVLFVVDTLSRAMPGGDENGPKDMGAVLNAVRHIRAETGAASLVLHHPGWNGDHGRGHSSQFGAVDVEMWMAGHVLTVRKLRDGEEGYEIAFRLKAITLGFREDGSRITSCYVETGKREEMQTPPTNGQAEVLKVVEAVVAEGKPITIKNIQTVIEKWRESGSSTFSGSSEKHAIRKMLVEVEEKHLMRRTQRGQWVIVKVEEVEESGGSKG